MKSAFADWKPCKCRSAPPQEVRHHHSKPPSPEPTLAHQPSNWLCRRLGNFALLKEGYAWHDAASGLLISLERVGPCHGLPGLPLYNHSGV